MVRMPSSQVLLNNALMPQKDSCDLATTNKSSLEGMDIILQDQDIESEPIPGKAKTEHTDDATITDTSSPKSSINNSLSTAPEIYIEGCEVAPAVAFSAPLLVGTLKTIDDRAIWEGEWGMTQAAFIEDGVTSKFEMKSVRSISEMLISPTSDAPVPTLTINDGTTFPTEANFAGFFQMKNTNSKDVAKSKAKGEDLPPITVNEPDVHLSFRECTTYPIRYLVHGYGSNKFGKFDLQGIFETTSSKLMVYKIYAPKAVKPRITAKRGRAARSMKSQTQTSVESPSVIKSKMKPTLITKTASKVIDTDADVASRGRSKRKSILPAHLREDMFPESNPKLQKCLVVLKHLMSSQFAPPFLTPVDPVALNIPDYLTVIKNPMDLGLVQRKLEQGDYSEPLQFALDVRLVFTNATTYNKPDHVVHQWAQRLLDIFDKKFKALEKSCVKEAIPEISVNPKLEVEKKEKREKKEKTKVVKDKVEILKGGRGAKPGPKKQENVSEIEAMKAQIEQMKAQIAMMNSTGGSSVVPPLHKASSVVVEWDAPEEDQDDKLDVPMTFQEKKQLSLDINALPGTKLSRVLQIIQERVPLDQQREDDEIEIDINSFDTRTLRILQKYVNECLRATRKTVPLTKPRRQRRTKAEMEMARTLELKKKMEKAARRAAAQPLASKKRKLSQQALQPTISSAESSDNSSDSSDTDSASASDSDSSDDEIQQSTMLKSNSSILMSQSLSVVEQAYSANIVNTTPTTEVVESTVIQESFTDQVSEEPVKVQNQSAWSSMMTSPASNSVQPQSTSGSLWSTARSEEQKRKQRESEIAAQQNRLIEAVKKENAAALEQLERQKEEKEIAQRHILEQRSLIAEQERADRRATARVEREKEEQSVDLDEQREMMYSMEEEFGSSSFSRSESSLD